MVSPTTLAHFTYLIVQQAGVEHVVENATMYGLQSVADIGEGAADDDGHRIVEIRPAHLFFDIYGLNIQRAGIAAFAGGWWG